MPLQPITVLYAELPGIADLSEKLDPDKLQSLLSELQELANATLRLHQGRISQFSGDSFYAVFPGQKTEALSSVLAIETAIEFKERLEILMEEMDLSRSIGFKSAIVKADAITTELDDSGKITIMGQAMTYANRLKDFAVNGQVLADGSIYVESKDRFDFLQLEPLPVRGSKEPLEVFELKGKKRLKLKIDSSSQRRIFSEMVGRTNEMELVEGQVKKLLSGKGGVVNIIGKAGIGKSRLVAELMAQDFMEKATVLESRALSIGQNLSFHPIVEIIKSWAGISEEDTVTISSEKLYQSIQKIAAENAEEIFPFIATMMGIPLSGDAKKRVENIEGDSLERLILKNLRDMIIKAASFRPLIIVIEDMHWSDSSTITFLESLFKLVKAHPVMFVNIFRPGHEKTGDHLLKYLEEILKENHLNITINTLTGKESTTLIENLLQKVALPPEINEMIIRKTEGNPFFIEEVIRSFIDEKVVEVHEKGFYVSDKIHEVNIPETINDVILSRVDKLDEKTKELLKTASAIGRNFYYKVLEEAADTIGELDERLSYLKEVELISESKKKEEIEYLFKHALAQQATYESIVLNTKNNLHLKIARSIEKVFSNNLHEFYGTLAYHYEQASVPDKAIQYLILAGTESMKAGSALEAEHHYRKALQLNINNNSALLDKKKLNDLYFSLADACQHNGNSHEAVHFIDEFFSYHGIIVPRNKIMKISGFLLNFLSFIFITRFPGRFFRKPATELTEKIILAIGIRGEALTATNPQRFFIETFFFTRFLCDQELKGSNYGPGYLAQVSALFFWTGISMTTAERIVRIAEKNIPGPQSASWLKYRFIKRMLEILNGHWKEEEDVDQLFEISLKQGGFWGTTIQLMFNSIGLLEQGKKEQSDRMLKMIDQLADTFESTYSRSQYLRQLGISLLKFRKIEAAVKVAEEGLEYAERTGHSAVLFICSCNRVILHCLLNEPEKAERRLKNMEELLKTHKRTKLYHTAYLIARCYYLLLKYSNDRNNHSLKKELLAESRSLVKNSRNVAFNITEAYRLRAMALWETGLPHKAFKTYEKGILKAKKINADLELSRMLFDVGKCLKDPASRRTKLSGLTADECLEQARLMFERMGMEWDLEQYQKFMASR